MSTLDLTPNTTTALIIISIVTVIIILLLISWFFHQRQRIRMLYETNYSPVKEATIEDTNIHIETESTATVESTSSFSRPPAPELLLSPSMNERKFSHHRKHEYMDNTRKKAASFSSMLSENSSFLETMDSVRILADVRFSISTRTERRLSDKRGFIESELIETEKSYLNTLHVLMNEFITPILSQNLIDIKHKSQITSNIPEIIQFHEEILQKLMKNPVAKVFNEQSEKFMIYTKYIADYNEILDIFAQNRTNERLKSFLASRRKERKPLTNYLVAPIQRIPRYILLLSDLKKNAKSARSRDIDCALNKITKVCNAINERQKEIENMSQCMKISQTLKNLDFDIVASERMYIDHFMFKRKSDGRNRQFFVLNDVVIIANCEWETKRVVQVDNFEVKRSDGDNQEVSIKILNDEERNKKYRGEILYESVVNAENVKSDTADFCKIVNEYRDRLRDTQKYSKIEKKISVKLISLMSERANVDSNIVYNC